MEPRLLHSHEGEDFEDMKFEDIERKDDWECVANADLVLHVKLV